MAYNSISINNPTVVGNLQPYISPATTTQGWTSWDKLMESKDLWDSLQYRRITKEELLEEFKTLMGKSDLTLEDLTDLQSKLFEMIDKVKSEKRVSIDITL